MKKVLLCKVLLFTIVAALLVSSCTIENIFPDKGLLDEKVAVLLPDASVIDRWATDKENLETIMYKYGFNTVFYTAPETEAGAALQVEQLKQVIEALIEAGIKNMPIITGQDNTLMAQENIKNHRQAMTIDKNLVDKAYNTALIINSLLCESPVLSNYSVNAGAISIPAFYSRNTLLTIDSY